MAVTESPTRVLARFVADLQFDQIPKPVVEHMKVCVLDGVGCGLFGSSLPWGRIIADFAKGLSGKQRESTVWGYPFKVGCADAALANGTMVHGFELDDLLTRSGAAIHPGSFTIPSALAVAEKVGGCSGRHFLTSVIAGYEVVARVGMCAGVSPLLKGYHTTGTHGTFGSAAAAGKVLNLNEESMVHALGIAGTQAAGLMAAQYSAMVKRMHAGRAAQSGVYGAFLARMGFTGITDVLEAEYGGYCRVISDAPDMAKLTNGLGQSWEVLNASFKSYACCAGNHTSMDAIHDIMAQNAIEPEAIEKITLRTTTASKVHVGWEYTPKGGIITAQMNLPYCAALMALEGQMFIDQFTQEKLSAPRVLDLVKRVEVIADPELDKLGPKHRYSVIAQIRAKDGRTFTQRVDHAKGSEQKPLSLDEVVEKYRALAGKVLPKKRVEETKATIERLEDVSDMRDFARLLAP